MKRKLQEINTQIIQECQKALELKSLFKFDGFISSKKPDLKVDGLKGNSSRNICVGTPKASATTKVTTKPSLEPSNEDKRKAFRTSFKGKKCLTNGFPEKDNKEEVDNSKNTEKKSLERAVTETKLEIAPFEKPKGESIELMIPFRDTSENKNSVDPTEETDKKIKSDNSIEEEAKKEDNTCHRPSRFKQQAQNSPQVTEERKVHSDGDHKGNGTNLDSNPANTGHKEGNAKTVEVTTEKGEKKPASIKTDSDDRPLLGEAFCTSSSEENEKEAEEEFEASLTSSKRNAQQELKKSRFFTAVPDKLKETKSDIIKKSDVPTPVEKEETKGQGNLTKDDMKLGSAKKKDSDSDDEGSCLGDKFDLFESDEEEEESEESEKQTKVEAKKSNFNLQSTNQVRESPPPPEEPKKKPQEPEPVFSENNNKNLVNPPNFISQLDSDNSEEEEGGLPGESTFEKLLKEEKKSERSVSPPDLMLKSSFSNIEKGAKFWSNANSRFKEEPAPMAPSQNIGLTSDNSLQSSSANATLDKEQRAKLFQSQRESFLLANKTKASQTQIFGSTNTAKKQDDVQAVTPKGQGSIDSYIDDMKSGKYFIGQLLK